MSHDDLYSIEGAAQVISLRSLKNHQLVAKYEGHLYPVQNLKFALSTYTFVSAGNSECMLWNPIDQIKNQVGDMIEEISQPEKILDQVSSDHITHVALKEIGDEKTFMISASSDQFINIYYTKISSAKAKGSIQKSKVVSSNCQINLGVHEQMI